MAEKKGMTPEQKEKMRLGREAKKAQKAAEENNATAVTVTPVTEGAITDIKVNSEELAGDTLIVNVDVVPPLPLTEIETTIQVPEGTNVGEIQEIVDEIKDEIIQEDAKAFVNELLEDVKNNDINPIEIDKVITDIVDQMKDAEINLNKQIEENPDDAKNIVQAEIEKVEEMEKVLIAKVNGIEQKLKPMTFQKMFGGMWNGW
jgi:hypothetical protein